MPKMKKLSEKAEAVIARMKADGWIELEYYPGICMVMGYMGIVKTVVKYGTVFYGNKAPQ